MRGDGGKEKKIAKETVVSLVGKKMKTHNGRRAQTEVIGIAGSGPAVGTTHFAVLTANYLTGVLQKKTAVIEWNDSGAFERMEKICVKRAVSKPENKAFIVIGVSYLKKAGKKELLECMNRGFDTVIIDFGSRLQEVQEEHLLCDRRFFVGSFCEWQADDFAKFAAERREKKGRWEYFYSFGSEDAAKEMKRRLCVSIRKIPNSQDAFTITGELMAFFRGFLND